MPCSYWPAQSTQWSNLDSLQPLCSLCVNLCAVLFVCNKGQTEAYLDPSASSFFYLFIPLNFISLLFWAKTQKPTLMKLFYGSRSELLWHSPALQEQRDLHQHRAKRVPVWVPGRFQRTQLWHWWVLLHRTCTEPTDLSTMQIQQVTNV